MPIHILTKNNASTVLKTLESLASVHDSIYVADLGSSDGTQKICSEFGAKVFYFPDEKRHIARNMLTEKVEKAQFNFWIEPWEILIQGHQSIQKFNRNAAYVSIIQSGHLSKEIRLWNGTPVFEHPVYERIALKTDRHENVVIGSSSGMPQEEAMNIISRWKSDEPFLPLPYYYQACLELMSGKIDQFFKTSEHYMYLDRTDGMHAIMNRYYYAMAQTHRGKVRPALQNINLCLCAKPLMAEFWCLMGDVFYHNLNKFSYAKEFYQNAMIMGSRRLSTDEWPMEIAKYKKYPLQMIESCNGYLNPAIFRKRG